MTYLKFDLKFAVSGLPETSILKCLMFDRITNWKGLESRQPVGDNKLFDVSSYDLSLPDGGKTSRDLSSLTGCRDSRPFQFVYPIRGLR